MVENKDLDMFKLAEEVAKQKNAQDVSLDNIFSDLDNTLDSYKTKIPSERVLLLKENLFISHLYQLN